MNETAAAADVDLLHFQVAALEQLLQVQEQSVIEQSQRLESMLRELESQREALRWSEERTHAIIDAALDAIISIDASSDILDWNPQAEKILGWSRAEAIGQKLENLIVPDRYRERHRRGMQSYLASGEGPMLNKRIEISALHRNGREFPVELSVSPVGSGTRTIFSAFLRDITQRKEAEEQLSQARDVAVTASRMKSEFLATMSHEVRTPMNGVIGMAELLLTTDLTPEQQEYARTIQVSADALLAILNDILDFSKIEAGKLTLESIPFDLRLLVEETVDLLAPLAAQKGLELIVRYSSEAPWNLIGDAGRLRQVLTNLSGNAIKFTETGHVLINIECDEQTETMAQMRVSVEDTGIGIPEGQFEHIFDKFTQTDGSTTRKYGGTGLGLAISKSLIEAMGGAIAVTSELGKGSAFWFSVSLLRDMQAAAPPPTAIARSGLRVLIVDDNHVNRRVLQEQLNRLGILASSAAGGEEALRTLRLAREAGAPFQIGLLDYKMPGMDGEVLGGAIKSDPALRDMRLVLLTSAGNQGESARLLKAGFSACLSKPLLRSQLMQALTGSELLLNPDVIAGSPRAPAARSEGHGSAHRARILVAEDNPVNQAVIARMLEKLHCRVDIAANGKQAVEMVAAIPYDMVFMDCQMPEMDGFEAALEIRRRQGYHHHTPIIALTSNAMQGDRERCLDAGMDGYISKPMKPPEISAALEQWLAPTTAKAE